MCLIHDKCLAELRKFTQADEFHIYTSLEEAENACSDAKDAYVCVQSAPECRDLSEEARLSPLIRGSYRLLNEFCGYRSKRRPCCALRTAYLEHSSCYKEVGERLNNCNKNFRKSMDLILTMSSDQEQRKQRYCSVKWFGNCVRKATQSYCGKVAAQIIKSYVMKAGKPQKAFVEQNQQCHEAVYGQEEDEKNFCDQKYFQKCHVHLLFLQEYLVEDRLTDDDKYLSICAGVHDSLECLKQSLNRCMTSRQSKKFERLRENELQNEACLVKENVLQKYRGRMYCLAQHTHQLSECLLENQSLTEHLNNTIRPTYYNQHFCGLLRKVETCWIEKATSFCGDAGKRIMSDISLVAAFNLHQRCNI